MEKIWELILILALVGMMFILQLDHKNNMEKSQEKQDEDLFVSFSTEKYFRR